jgi:DNA ligase (NAD+)
MDIQITIQNLREELNQHNHNYYVLDQPTISDFEFDVKLKQLQDLENQYPEFFDENSPTQRVGGTITKNFATVTHDYRMYSLDNSYSKDDLLDLTYFGLYHIENGVTKFTDWYNIMSKDFKGFKFRNQGELF